MNIKPQPTLKGYNAWAFNELISILGYSPAEGAAWVIDHWLEQNRVRLEKKFDISVKKYCLLLDGNRPVAAEDK